MYIYLRTHRFIAVCSINFTSGTSDDIALSPGSPPMNIQKVCGGGGEAWYLFSPTQKEHNCAWVIAVVVL